MIRGTAASASFKEEKTESDLPKPAYPPQTQIVRLAAPPSTSNGTRVVKNANSPQQLRVFHHKNGKLVSLANTNITPGHNPGTWLHNGKPITIVFDKPGAKSVGPNGQSVRPMQGTVRPMQGTVRPMQGTVRPMQGGQAVRPMNGVVNGQSPVGIKKSPQFINGRMVNSQAMGMPHNVQQQGYNVKQSPRQLPQHPQIAKQNSQAGGAGLSYASHPSQHPSQPQPKQRVNNQQQMSNNMSLRPSHVQGVQQQQGNSQEQYEQYPQYEEQVQASHNLPLQISPPPPHLEYSQSSTGSTMSTSTEESTEDKKRRMYYKPTQQGAQQQSDTTLNLLWNNNSVMNGIMHPNKKRVQESPHVERKRGRRSSEKGGKGLRHFSSKVCEKVQQKGVTSYVEVSDELVAEFADPANLTPSDHVYDSKNIRRRVYDALNVLFAMNIISKEKKEIRWVGLPTNSLQECHALEEERKETMQRIKNKKKRAQELMLQLIAYRTLINRNKESEERTGPLPQMSTIQVPFIILSTGPNTEIGLTVSSDKTKYEFTFDDMFEIHDEFEILRKMGMCYGLDQGNYSDETLQQAEELLPNTARPYLKELFPKKDPNQNDGEIQPPPAPSAHPSSIKTEPPQSDIQRQALETFQFNAPPYSSPYDAKKERNLNVTGEVANTLLSLVNGDQGPPAFPVGTPLNT